jgi:hypothetical protein
MPNPGDVLTYTVAGKTDWAPVPAGPTIPFALLETVVINVPPASSVNIDIPLNVAAYTDTVTRFRAEVYGTTKQNAGAGTANMTNAAYIVSEAVYDNKNAAVSFAVAAAGGAANPMPAQNNEMTLTPQVTDPGLTGGGGAAMNAVWSVSGGTTARLTITNGNALNTANCEVDIYQRKKAA